MLMSPAVIFDVDGVLVDSYRAHLESWQLLARDTGVPFGEPQFAATFGRTSRDIIGAYWDPAGDLDDTAVRKLDDRKEALYRDIIADAFPDMDGAPELIASLRNEGIRMGVGSSGPPENVRLVIATLHAEKVFEAIVTGEDVTRGKPDPQVFEIAAQRLGVEAARCIVIEDAAAGITAAHAAGMKCVALVSTGRTIDELKRADLTVASLRDLSPHILRELIR